MAQRTAPGPGFGRGNLPVICDNGRLRVYRNPAGEEIFVENIQTGVYIRIETDKDGLEFTTNGLVEPVRVSNINMIGWHIGPRGNPRL